MTALRKTPVALHSDAAPFVIRAERASDTVAREALLDACFGANRHQRTCQRLRDGRYYARFGFSGLKTGELSLPGPFERDRLLGLELRAGALDGGWGMIAPTGASVSPTKARRAKVLRSVPYAARPLNVMAANPPTTR